MKKLLVMLITAACICMLPAFASAQPFILPEVNWQFDPNSLQMVDPNIAPLNSEALLEAAGVVSYINITPNPNALAAAGSVNVAVSIVNRKDEALKNMFFAKSSSEGMHNVGEMLTEIPANSTADYTIAGVPVTFGELNTDITINVYYKVGASSETVEQEFSFHIDKASSTPQVKITSYVNPTSIDSGDEVMVDYYIENNSVDEIKTIAVADKILAQDKEKAVTVVAGGHTTISTTAVIEKPISSVATLTYTYQGTQYTVDAAPVVISVAMPSEPEPTSKPTSTPKPTKVQSTPMPTHAEAESEDENADPSIAAVFEAEDGNLGQNSDVLAQNNSNLSRLSFFQIFMVVLLGLVLISVVALMIVLSKKSKKPVVEAVPLDVKEPEALQPPKDEGPKGEL